MSQRTEILSNRQTNNTYRNISQAESLPRLCFSQHFLLISLIQSLGDLWAQCMGKLIKERKKGKEIN